MIKINLIKSKVAAALPEVGVHEFSSEKEGRGPSSTDILLLKNLIIICIFPAALYFYQSQVESQLTYQKRKVSNEQNRIQQELIQKKQFKTQLDELAKKLEVTQKKYEALVNLPKDRLLEVKMLDTIQSIIPEKVWLNQLNYRERGLELYGTASSDDDLNGFTKALESRPIFKDVVLRRAKDEKNNSGVVKSFYITSKIESGGVQ